jgi:putative pyruvate formate lyase activating enzyme
LEALVIAAERGLCLPIVYNTSGYTSLLALEWLDGVIDIYMPDFKIANPDEAHLYLQARNYPKVAESAIREMHRQVGDLVLDQRGIAQRGLIIRHLVMPEGIAATGRVMEILAEISPDTFINIMGQYHPAGKVGVDPRFNEINRRPTHSEMINAYEIAQAAGLWRFNAR